MRYDLRGQWALRPTAFLVNSARGDVIDQDALVKALRSGTIAGAGLDVYEGEPAVPQTLRELENAVLLPTWAPLLPGGMTSDGGDESS